ncbi:MAG TPA: lysozyme [Edaphobacter sp.]|nr:lysozyme [Edaphobacter sp.]
MANFKYSANGLALTERFEGLRLDAYQDTAGVWTIGYGHTGPDVQPSLTITQEQTEILLAADVAWAAACVNKAVKSPINQNQFDALVDFTFNLGCASLVQSSLLHLVNTGDFAAAALQFLRWNKAGGQALKGLTLRRQAEMDLFNTPVASAIPAGAHLQAAAASHKRPARKAAGKTTAPKPPGRSATHRSAKKR